MCIIFNVTTSIAHVCILRKVFVTEIDLFVLGCFWQTISDAFDVHKVSYNNYKFREMTQPRFEDFIMCAQFTSMRRSKVTCRSI